MAQARGRDLNRKKKCVADGLFYAELNHFLQTHLAEEGYAGVEVRSNVIRTEIIIKATRVQNVLGEKRQRCRELTQLVQKRFGFPDNVEIFAERVQNRGTCANAQAESLRYKLRGGLPMRRACYGVLRYVMESGAKGCEIVVSGKIRAQRAKCMKFRDGYMIKSGDSKNNYVDVACRHILMKQGTLGIQVKIMLPYDPTGVNGVKKPLSDIIEIKEPKADPIIPQQPVVQQSQPTSQVLQQPQIAMPREQPQAQGRIPQSRYPQTQQMPYGQQQQPYQPPQQQMRQQFF